MNRSNVSYIDENGEISKAKFDGLYVMLARMCETAKTPLTVKHISEEYRKLKKCTITSNYCERVIRTYRDGIHSRTTLDLATKVKQMFVLGASVSDKFFTELEQNAYVTLDYKERIAKYTSHDGTLQLGVHSGNDKKKSTNDASSTPSAAPEIDENQLLDEKQGSTSAFEAFENSRPVFVPKQEMPFGKAEGLNSVVPKPEPMEQDLVIPKRKLMSGQLANAKRPRFVVPKEEQEPMPPRSVKVESHLATNPKPEPEELTTSTSAAGNMRRAVPLAAHRKLIKSLNSFVCMNFDATQMHIFSDIHKQIQLALEVFKDYETRGVEVSKKLRMDDLKSALISFVLCLRKNARTTCEEPSKGARDFTMSFRFVLYQLELPELRDFNLYLAEFLENLSLQEKIPLKTLETALAHLLYIISPEEV